MRELITPGRVKQLNQVLSIPPDLLTRGIILHCDWFLWRLGDKLKPWDSCRDFCSACSRQNRHLLGVFLVTSYGRKWQLDIREVWVPEHPKVWVCLITEFAMSGRCSQVQNLILDGSIQHPWRCRYRSRCDLWTIPVKDTSMGNATTFIFLIYIFQGWMRHCEIIFVSLSSSFFFLPCMRGAVGALLLLGGSQWAAGSSSCAESCDTQCPAWWRLLADFYFVPPTEKWKIPLTEVAGSSLLYVGKHNT